MKNLFVFLVACLFSMLVLSGCRKSDVLSEDLKISRESKAVKENEIFNIQNFISCYDEVSKVIENTTFEKKYGRLSENPITIKNDMVSNIVFPLIENGEVVNLLHIDKNKEIHIINKTKYLSVENINNTNILQKTFLMFELRGAMLNRMGSY